MTLQRFPVAGPWKGIVTDLPSAMDDQALDDCVNMFCRKGRIQSRPRFEPFLSPPDGQPIRAIATFEDVLNNFHTIVLTSQTAYMLARDGGDNLFYGLLILPSGIPSLAGTGLPYAIREMNQQFYFCNGSTSLLYSDGSVNVQVAGDVPGGCQFLTENSESLIGVNWIEPSPGISGSFRFPFRVRWSDTGDPTEWINAPGNTAGALDLVESGGELNGCATVGRNTIITRRQGFTTMYPTGNASQLFATEPTMYSQPGWGNYYTYSLVVWGPSMFCLTESAELLMFDGSNFSRLAAGKVRERLAQDLQGAHPDEVYCFGTSSMGPGYDLEGYWISIPSAGIVWMHDLTEGTWQRVFSQSGIITAMAKVAVR